MKQRRRKKQVGGEIGNENFSQMATNAGYGYGGPVTPGYHLGLGGQTFNRSATYLQNQNKHSIIGKRMGFGGQTGRTPEGDIISTIGQNSFLGQMGRKFRRGGTVRKYLDGGGTSYDFGNPNATQYNSNVPQGYQAPQTQTYQMSSGQMQGQPISTSPDSPSNPKGVSSTGYGAGSYGQAAVSIGQGLSTWGNTNNNPNLTKDQKNNANTYNAVNTTVNTVGAFVPAVGIVKGAADAGKGVVDSTNPNTTTVDPYTGKSYTYKGGANGDNAAAWKASYDPVGNVTNGIGSFTGSTENYGNNNVGMGVLDFAAPFISAGLRNKGAREAGEAAKYNNPNKGNIIQNSVNNNYDNSYLAGSRGVVNNQVARYGGRFGMGGQSPTTTINIEGNELMTNPKGTIVRDFKHYPPHPEYGTNPMGNVDVPQGHTIVPANRRKYFQEASRDTRKATIAGLGIMQKNRERSEMMKSGGMIPKAGDGYTPYNTQGSRVDPNQNYGPDPNQFDFQDFATAIGANPQQIGTAFMNGEMEGQPGNQGSYDDLTKVSSSPYSRYQGRSFNRFQPNYNVPSLRQNNSPYATPTGREYLTKSRPSENYNTYYNRTTNNGVQSGSGVPMDKPQRQGTDWRGIGNTALEYAPVAYNIGMGLFDKTQKLNANDYRINPIVGKHLSDNESLTEIGTAYNTGLYNLKNSGNYSRSGQVSLAAQRMKAAAASRERIANANAGIDNQIAAQNADIQGKNVATRFSVADWNAKSQAAKRNQLDTGIGQLSDLSVQDRYGKEERDAIEYYYPNSYKRKKRRGGKV